jgi:hypothetical protein
MAAAHFASFRPAAAVDPARWGMLCLSTRMAVPGSIHPMSWLYQRVAKGAAVSIRFFMAAAGVF